MPIFYVDWGMGECLKAGSYNSGYTSLKVDLSLVDFGHVEFVSQFIW